MTAGLNMLQDRPQNSSASPRAGRDGPDSPAAPRLSLASRPGLAVASSNMWCRDYLDIRLTVAKFK